MKDPDLESLIPRYRAHLESRALAPASLRQYLRAVRLFTAFLKRRKRSRPCDIRLIDLEAFREHTRSRIAHQPDRRSRQAPGLHAADAYTRAVASFCRWLVHEELLLLDPSQDLAPVRLQGSHPRILTRAEAEALMESTSGDDPLDLRDRAILEVFYASALRFRELLELDVEDIDLHGREVIVRRGKGGAARRAPLGDWAVDALRRYLERGHPALLNVAPPLESTSAALWLSSRGGRMSDWTLDKVVPHRAVKAGLRGRVTAHSLRHTAAVHLLQGGASVRHIQEMLGHRSAQTTVRYTSLVLDDLKLEWKRHPRACLEESIDGMDE